MDEGVPAHVGTVVDSIRPAVYFFFNPRTDAQVVNVLVFESDGSAVGFLQVGDDFPERQGLPFSEGADVDGLVHVFRPEAHVRRIDGSGCFIRGGEGIEVGALVSHDPVGPDELVDAPAAFRTFRRNRVGGGVRAAFLFLRSVSLAQFITFKPCGPERLYGERVIFP